MLGKIAAEDIFTTYARADNSSYPDNLKEELSKHRLACKAIVIGYRNKLSEVPNPTFAAGFVLRGQRFYFSADHVYVYDTETGQRIGILTHRGETQGGVASFNEGSQILTIGFEGIGRLWDAQDLVELARFAMPDYYPFGLFGLKGGRFVTHGDYHDVEVWDLSEAWLAKTLCAGTIGTLEVEELRRVGLPPEGANICGTVNLQP